MTWCDLPNMSTWNIGPGAPRGTVGRLVGVVYGSHDSFTIAEEDTIDYATGQSSAEIRRYVAFDLAQVSSLGQLSVKQPMGRPLRELMATTATTRSRRDP
jgi:hypothetical protein